MSVDKDEVLAFEDADADDTGISTTTDTSTSTSKRGKGSKGKGKGATRGKGQTKTKTKKPKYNEDEHLGATKEERKRDIEGKSRQVKIVEAPLSPEETSDPFVEPSKILKKKTDIHKAVLDPNALRAQERKTSYSEGEINPAAPPAGGRAIIDVRKMGRKESYAEGEINPACPPNPV